MSRAVFCSSAFIGQGAAAVTGSAELERRIAGVVSSGEEEVSAGEAAERLRAWMRARRYNRRGAIPELEGEIAAAEESLRRVSDTVAERERARAELARCAARADALTEKLRASQESERSAARESFERSGERVSEAERAYTAAAEAAARARAAALGGPFEGMDAAGAVEKARSEAERAELLMRAGEAKPSPLWAGVCAALALLFTLLAIVVSPFELIGTAVFAALAAWRYRIYRAALESARGAAAQLAELLGKYSAKSPEDIGALAADYARRRSAADEAESALERAKEALAAARAARRADESRFTGAQESPALRQLSWELASMNANRESLTEKIAELSGAISAMGDPVAVESGIRDKQERLAALMRQYDAIELAAGTLERAGAELQGRFSPALGRRAAELFSRLTGGRYDAVTVSRDFSVLVHRAGDSVQRGSLYLSAGAADLMYMAVRLAIAELALPGDEPCPIILDDALAYLDPVRRERVLALLTDMSRERQIILFTCA